MHPAPLHDSSLDPVPSADGQFEPVKSVLIVDDDPQMLGTLEYYFSRQCCAVATASTVADARTTFAGRAGWSLVVADHHLPDGNGTELCQWIRAQPGAPPCLLISGALHRTTPIKDIDFLPKPFSLAQLASRVERWLGEWRSTEQS
jgi:DNA-binding response OmpR family regulator